MGYFDFDRAMLEGLGQPVPAPPLDLGMPVAPIPLGQTPPATQPGIAPPTNPMAVSIPPAPLPPPPTARPATRPADPFAEAMSATRDATKREADATLASGDIRARANAIKGAGDEAVARDAQTRQADDQAFRQNYEAGVAEKRAALASEIDDLKNTRIDPDRVYKNMGTLESIVTAAALFAGGYMAHKNNGRNVALDIMAKKIDQDISAQLADIDTRKAAIGAKGTLLQQDIALGRDSYDARVKATALAFDTASKTVLAQAERVGSDAARADAAAAAARLEGMGQERIAKIEAERQSARASLISAGAAAKNADTARIGEINRNAQWIAGFGQHALEDARDRTAKLAAVAGTGVPRFAVYGVADKAGAPVAAPSEKVAEDLNGKAAVAATIVRSVQRVADIADELGEWRMVPRLLMPERMQRLADEASTLWVNSANFISTAEEQGQVRQGEWGVVKKALGSPDDWVNPRAHLETTRRFLGAYMDEQIEHRTGARLREPWIKQFDPVPGERRGVGNAGVTLPYVPPPGVVDPMGFAGGVQREKAAVMAADQSLAPYMQWQPSK